MLNIRRVDLETFEVDFDTAFSEAISNGETANDIVNRLFGIPDITIIVNHFKQFQQRRQCIQRLQTYHMCKTCYLEGVCLCEDCYDPLQHEGHNVVERRGNGFCDCGIMKNGGCTNCRNHNPHVPVRENLLQIAFGNDLEYAKAIVMVVLQRIVRFVRVTFAERLQTNFGMIMNQARVLLQAEALYQLFGELSSEIFFGEDSFFHNVYRELWSTRSFTDSFRTYFVHGWYVALAMHPSNYKHYGFIVKPDYRDNVRFISESLLNVYEFPFRFVHVTNVIDFDRNLSVINEIMSFYFDPDIMKIPFPNTILLDGIKVLQDLIRHIYFVIPVQLKHANYQEMKRSLLLITKAVIQYTPNCRLIKEDDLLYFRDTIYRCLGRMEDDVIENLIQLLHPIDSSNKNNTLKMIIEHCFNENKIKPIEGVILHFGGNLLKLPSVSFKPFEHIEEFIPIETTHDILDLSKLPQKQLSMDMMNESMNIIKMMIEMQKHEENKEKDTSLIEFIEEKYPSIDREMILILIVWYFNFSVKQMSLYLLQRSYYKNVQEYINNNSSDQVQLSMNEIISTIKLHEKIVCNPFVPLAFGYQQNLYLFLSYCGKKTIGQWKGETHSEFLKSPDLSALMVETFEKQPLYVIHLLWKRVLLNIKIKDDEMGIMIFSMFSDFLKMYPMLRNELFQLSIAYEDVTTGSQQMFIDSMIE